MNCSNTVVGDRTTSHCSDHKYPPSQKHTKSNSVGQFLLLIMFSIGTDACVKCLTFLHLKEILAFGMVCKASRKLMEYDPLWNKVGQRYLTPTCAGDDHKQQVTIVPLSDSLLRTACSPDSTIYEFYRDFMSHWGGLLGYWWLGPRAGSQNIEQVMFKLHGNLADVETVPPYRGMMLEIRLSPTSRGLEGYACVPVQTESHFQQESPHGTVYFKFKMFRKLIFTADSENQVTWTFSGVRKSQLINALRSNLRIDLNILTFSEAERTEIRHTSVDGFENLRIELEAQSRDVDLDSHVQGDAILFSFLKSILDGQEPDITANREHVRCQHTTAVNLSGMLSDILHRLFGPLSDEDQDIPSIIRYMEQNAELSTLKQTFFRLPVSRIVGDEDEMITKKKSVAEALQGVWCKSYFTHGCEFQLFNGSQDDEFCSWIKVTGDPNIPSGCITMYCKTADMTSFGIEIPGYLQTSVEGYAAPEWQDIRIRLVSPQEVHILWSVVDFWTSMIKIMA
jgi:hypothetical protein